MSVSSAADATSSSSDDPLARLAFVGNVHRLFALGYARLDAPTLSTADENRLTQVLVEALRAATEDPFAPESVVNFSIHEKQRQNDGKLEGNSRLELDICFERTGRGTHPIFKVEAKPLGPGHHLGITSAQRKTYLGQDGLGAFISSEYASEHEDAGMLGYVQSKAIEEWVDLLQERLGASPGDFSITSDGAWQAHGFSDGPPFTYRTRHARAKGFAAITIFHTLLDFRRRRKGAR
jgi:hypothetical protein